METHKLFPDQPFQITYGNTVLRIRPVDMPGRLAFYVSFSSERKPLLVVRAKDFNASSFWTSMPEGRQKEAEGVGKLIEEYLAGQQKKPQ
jgi:hypothetical protein